MPNQPAGAFWAVLNRLLIIFQVIVLIMSEVGWPAAFFNRFFPILGDDFGLGALGVIQCLYVDSSFVRAGIVGCASIPTTDWTAGVLASCPGQADSSCKCVRCAWTCCN